MGEGGCIAFSLGVKWPGLEVDHSPPNSTEVKNTWIGKCNQFILNKEVNIMIVKLARHRFPQNIL
jgi:hypothetical protein